MRKLLLVCGAVILAVTYASSRKINFPPSLMFSKEKTLISIESFSGLFPPSAMTLLTELSFQQIEMLLEIYGRHLVFPLIKPPRGVFSKT
jgi:hypothetical protein